MKGRRLVVVRGERDSGEALVSETEVEPVEASLRPGFQWHLLWGSDLSASLTDAGAPGIGSRYFPPPGGFRCVIFTIPGAGARAASELDVAAASAEFERKLPGVQGVMDPEHPGMHATDTVDFDLVLSGEVGLVLDGGEEVTLRAGDSLVLCGARHAWRNHGDEPCVMLTVLFGAARV